MAFKYLVLVRCDGDLGRIYSYCLLVGLLCGVYCFRQSCFACHHAHLASYRFWHVAWHVAFPLTMSAAYLAEFTAPSRLLSCIVRDLY